MSTSQASWRIRAFNSFWFDIITLILVTATVMVLILQRTGAPTFDELYHILAAQSWAKDGTLTIGSGSYVRGWLFTKAVGVAMALFGDSTAVARIVPVIGGAAWSLIVFLWARGFLGRAVAWVAVLLLIFSDLFLNLSVFIRFYTWHGFFVFLAFALITIAIYSPAKGFFRFCAAIIALGSFVVALHLQASTLVAALGIVAWVALANLSSIVKIIKILLGRPLVLSLLCSIIAAVALCFFALDIPQALWEKYTHTALWNEGASILTYHWYFESNYPVLWGGIPFALIAASLYRPPFGFACVVIFFLAFILHSFGGMRAIRYIAYALPFFFLVGAIAIVNVAQWLRRAIRMADDTHTKGFLGSRSLVFPTWLLGLIVAFPFFLIANDGIQHGVEILCGKDEDFRDGEDWSASSPELTRIAKTVDVVVVTYSVAGFYYLGDIDYVLSRTIMLETDTRGEFGYDKRIGRRVISEAESLRQIMACNASGLIVIDKDRWGDPVRGTNAEAIALINENTSPVADLSGETVIAFTWRNERAGIDGSRCKEIYARP